MIKKGIFRTEFFMFAKTKKQVLTDLFPHLNPIEFFRVLIESFPLVFVIYNFLKAVFLFDIRIFIMVNFAQKHVHRPAVHSKIPVHCLIYHTFFPVSVSVATQRIRYRYVSSFFLPRAFPS